MAMIPKSLPKSNTKLMSLIEISIPLPQRDGELIGILDIW
jgi:hypothetical protein